MIGRQSLLLLLGAETLHVVSVKRDTEKSTAGHQRCYLGAEIFISRLIVNKHFCYIINMFATDGVSAIRARDPASVPWTAMYHYSCITLVDRTV